MNILALDSSSKAASCALVSEGRLIGEYYIDSGLTHSQTLMPMIEQLCNTSGISLQQVDRIAVSKGPGSFTGLRIGMANAKALAFALNIPCAGISTLLSLAYNLHGREGICATVLDARCHQVYYALFQLRHDKVIRLQEDAAAPMESLLESLTKMSGPIFLVGDGATLCFDYIKLYPDLKNRTYSAPPHLSLQHASSVGFAALQEDNWVSSDKLVPSYLRLSQAERELLNKSNH